MKTAIIIGNGESLKNTPLAELARRYDTFACNRIHLIYSQTTFRPSYYVRVEPYRLFGTPEQFFDECRLHIRLGEKCIFPKSWMEELNDHPNIEWVNTCHHFKYDHRSRKAPRAWHLPFLCDVNTVSTMMQIAVLKGYGRIVLVGCDLNGGHFSTQDQGWVQTERLKRVHKVAARDCPIPVYNATLGGLLEAYPRMEVKELL